MEYCLMPVALNGSTSGSVTITAPAVAGTTTLTLPATTGTFNTSGAVNEVPAGSVSAPSIYSTGDTNTGIFFPAADTIAFVEGGVESMRIDSSGYMQGTVNGLGAGRIPAMQYYRLNSALAGANSTAAQNMLGVGVTLVANTQYAFEYLYVSIKSAGTTAHSFSLLFGGTAVVNNILYNINQCQDTSLPGGGQNFIFASNVATATVVDGSSSSAATTQVQSGQGTVSISTGGTFIPQYILSAAPGGAYTTQIGSYFRIWPLAASGSNVSIGSWA
jgi:hypothetical protein